MAIIKRRILLRALGIGILNLLVLSRADAATIIVNSLTDPGAPGTCSIRDAISAANSQARVNGCKAGSGNDIINFSVTGTIQLAVELPGITDTQLTINGPITVSGTNARFGGVLGVASNLATVNLKNMTIENGTSGRHRYRQLRQLDNRQQHRQAELLYRS